MRHRICFHKFVIYLIAIKGFSKAAELNDVLLCRAGTSGDATTNGRPLLAGRSSS